MNFITTSVAVLSLGLALILGTGVALAHGDDGDHADHGDEKGKSVTLTGEVMDLTCYMQHPKTGQGAEHASCAKQCIKKNLPAGLKTKDGKIYLLIGKGHNPVADLVADFAGHNAKIKGTLVEKAGTNAIIVESAVRAK